MANMRGIMPALQKAPPTSIAAGAPSSTVPGSSSGNETRNDIDRIVHWLIGIAVATAPTASAASDSLGTDYWLTFIDNYSGGAELTLFMQDVARAARRGRA
jgi:hypothetical protein